MLQVCAGVEVLPWHTTRDQRLPEAGPRAVILEAHFLAASNVVHGYEHHGRARHRPPARPGDGLKQVEYLGIGCCRARIVGQAAELTLPVDHSVVRLRRRAVAHPSGHQPVIAGGRGVLLFREQLARVLDQDVPTPTILEREQAVHVPVSRGPIDARIAHQHDAVISLPR